MRTYPTNSPEAAARLLAMALIADGYYSMTEIRALDRLDVPNQLGLSAQALKGVIDDFCQDILSASTGEWSGSSQLDEDTRQALIDEVQDPALRLKVLALCESLALADGHLAEGEALMLDALVKAWRMQAVTEN
ncbi:MAG: hypothetical protein RLZZ352_246 [Pseudomonadota bacterium]|jgi:uncharacterized tellurite resistance protein B-like protein